MAALPAVSRPRFSRGNRPYEDNTTQLNLARSVIFSLIQNLIDTATGGTTDGTRHANSIATVKGSSNSSSFSTAGVNHISARTNLVWAAVGVAHSWIWLELPTFGLQIVIDCITGVETTISIAATRIAVPFTGGSLTARPTSTEEFLWGTTSTGTTAVSYLADTTTGGTNNTHFACDDEGAFQFMASRAGTGIVFLYIALVKTTGASAGDVRNYFWLGGSSSSARGAPSKAMLETSVGGCIGRNPNGVAIQAQGGVGVLSAGGTVLGGSGSGYTTDAISGKWNSTPCAVWGGVSAGSQYAYRGMIPDMYTITTATIGASIPSVAAQTRAVVGDYIIPFPGAALTV